MNLTLGGHGEITGSGDSVHTFSGLSINTADAARIVFCALYFRTVGPASATVNSITIGGVAASSVLAGDSVAGASGWYRLELWKAAVPTGTTADVVVTFSSTVFRSQVILHTTVDAFNATPFDTATNKIIGDPVDYSPVSLTLDVDVANGGFVLGAFGSSMNPGYTLETSWSGLTEDQDVQNSNSRLGTAVLNDGTASTPLAVTGTTTGTANNILGVIGLTVSYQSSATDAVAYSLGVAAANAVGDSLVTSNASAQASSFAYGYSAETTDAIALASGVSTANAVGGSIADSIASASSAASAQTIGATYNDSHASALADASGIFVGDSTISAAANAVASSIAQGVSSIIEAVASATGSAVAQAVAFITASADATASAVSSATAIDGSTYPAAVSGVSMASGGGSMAGPYADDILKHVKIKHIKTPRTHTIKVGDWYNPNEDLATLIEAERIKSDSFRMKTVLNLRKKILGAG